jgi:hypothetical protein
LDAGSGTPGEHQGRNARAKGDQSAMIWFVIAGENAWRGAARQRRICQPEKSLKLPPAFHSRIFEAPTVFGEKKLIPQRLMEKRQWRDQNCAHFASCHKRLPDAA